MVQPTILDPIGQPLELVALERERQKQIAEAVEHLRGLFEEIRSYPGSFRSIQAALTNLRQLAKENALPCNGRKRRRGVAAQEKELMAFRKENYAVKLALAQSRVLLAARDKQVSGLLEEGLCLAFQKEALQRKVTELLLLCASRDSDAARNRRSYGKPEAGAVL